MRERVSMKIEHVQFKCTSMDGLCSDAIPHCFSHRVPPQKAQPLVDWVHEYDRVVAWLECFSVQGRFPDLKSRTNVLGTFLLP